jgi:ribosomal protein S8
MLMRNKYKLYIISTSRGLMSGFESNKMNIGGELLCEIF